MQYLIPPPWPEDYWGITRIIHRLSQLWPNLPIRMLAQERIYFPQQQLVGAIP